MYSTITVSYLVYQYKPVYVLLPCYIYRREILRNSNLEHNIFIYYVYVLIQFSSIECKGGIYSLLLIHIPIVYVLVVLQIMRKSFSLLFRSSSAHLKSVCPVKQSPAVCGPCQCAVD